MLELHRYALRTVRSKPCVRLSVPSINSSGGGRRVCCWGQARVSGRHRSIAAAAAAARHAGCVNFGPAVRRSNVPLCFFRLVVNLWHNLLYNKSKTNRTRSNGIRALLVRLAHAGRTVRVALAARQALTVWPQWMWDICPLLLLMTPRAPASTRKLPSRTTAPGRSPDRKYQKNCSRSRMKVRPTAL